MAKNVGPEDRIVRIVGGIALFILIFVGVLGEGSSIVAGIIGAYLLLSGVLARCVFYKMIGIDTSIQEQPYSTTDDRAGL